MVSAQGGFSAYKERPAHPKEDGMCEWKNVKDIDIDGEFGDGSARCLRDFQAWHGVRFGTKAQSSSSRR